MNDGFDAFMTGVATVMILLLFIGPFVSRNTDNSWRQQIVQHGCAEYYLDSNNERQWNWKECK